MSARIGPRIRGFHWWPQANWSCCWPRPAVPFHRCVCPCWWCRGAAIGSSRATAHKKSCAWPPWRRGLCSGCSAQATWPPWIGIARCGLTRRRFLQAGVAGLTGLALSSVSGWLKQAAAQLPPGSYNPQLQLSFPVEPGASLRILRWSQFVSTDQPEYERMAQQFTRRTGVPVRLEYEAWPDVQPKAAAAANVGAGPDIVLGFFDEPHLWPDKLVPVTDLAEYLGRKYGGWFPVAPQYGYSNQVGQWIGVPIGAPGSCLNYRMSWVKEAGFDPDPASFPKTTDEFLRLCRALKTRGHPTGFALGKAVGDANSWCHWLLWTFGAHAVAPDNKTTTLNAPETVNALEYGRQLFETMIPGVAGWLDPNNNRAFLAGEVALTNNGISIYFAAKNDFPEVAADMNHAVYPQGPAGGPPHAPFFS